MLQRNTIVHYWAHLIIEISEHYRDKSKQGVPHGEIYVGCVPE